MYQLQNANHIKEPNCIFTNFISASKSTTMKRTNFLLLIASLLPMTFVSCDESKDSPDISGSSIHVDPQELSFSKSGGAKTISVEGGSTVSAEVDVDWLSVSCSQGTPASVAITAQENSSFDSRSATVTIKCGGAETSVPVYQSPEDLLEPDDDTNKRIVLQAYMPNGDGATFFATYYANGTPDIELPWWIKEVSTVDADETYKHKSEFLVLKNYGVERFGKVVFTLGDKSFACQVQQSATTFDFSDVSKTAIEVSDAIKCGWTFTGLDDVDALASLEQGVLDTVALAGINAVRIPCNFLSSDNSVSELTLNNLSAAVKAITSHKVGDEAMFAIVSVKDDGWLSDHVNSSDIDDLVKTFDLVWSQVANELIECDYHVIFEGYDHIDVTATSTDAMYKRLNEAFVDAVRHTGANNFKRCLIIPSGDQIHGVYVSQPENDENPDRLMASFSLSHPLDYTVPTFTKSFWGNEYMTIGGDNWSQMFTEDNITSTFSYIRNKWPRIPIVLNSCGTVAHSSLNGKDDACVSSEAAYIKCVSSAAASQYFTPILYDDGVCAVKSYGVFSLTDANNRTKRQKYIQAFVEGAGGTYEFSK